MEVDIVSTKGGRFQSIFFGSGSGSVLAKFRFSVPGCSSVLLCSKALNLARELNFVSLENEGIKGYFIIQNSPLLPFCQNVLFGPFCWQFCKFYLINPQNRPVLPVFGSGQISVLGSGTVEPPTLRRNPLKEAESV